MNDTNHFVSHWRVRANVEEVYDIINQPLEYPRWWPAVYLEVKETTAAGTRGLGRRVSVRTKGWLPYTLRWEALTVEAVAPGRIAVESSGDLNGLGVWSFVQDGDFTDVTYDWNFTVTRPLLRYLTPVMRPVFEANRRWAMAQGEASLREELIRYRARTPEELMVAAEPRGPVEVPVRWVALGAVLALSAVAYVALTRRKSRKSETAAA